MIYILEDDENILELVIYALQTQNFQVKGFCSPKDFLEALQDSIPQLILLDIMLPQQDGLSILQNLKSKKNTKDIPIILLTAKNTEFDKVKGLDMGADDYITKPFGIMELIARIKAVLRRLHFDKKKEMFQIGDFSFDHRKHQVQIKNQAIDLTLKEYNLLYLFLCHPNIVFTREQIAHEVWGDDFVGMSRTIDMHIKTLRQKLGEYGALITTIRGVGYKLQQEDFL